MTLGRDGEYFQKLQNQCDIKVKTAGAYYFFNIDVIVFPFEHQGPVKERLSNPYSSVFSNLMQIWRDDLFNIGVDSIKTLCYIT